MKRALVCGWLMAAALFAPPLLTGSQGAAAEKAARRPEQAAPQPAQEQAAQPRRDADVALRVKTGEAVTDTTLADYLPGVVRGEMPPSFEMEALKAQAVAERTFICRQLAAGRKAAHPDADVCTDPDCCSAWLSEQAARQRWGAEYAALEARVDSAVQETDGQILLYDGAPILAVFHSSSAGVTASSGDVWTSDLPYLQSVASPESGDTVPNYYSVVTVSAETLRAAVSAARPEADFSGDPARWVGELKTNGSGRVECLRVGGVSLSGTEVRRLFSLRSASFTVSWDGEAYVFHVTGYGHGVGMSQYGANVLARQGKTWQEILLWYYTGASVGQMS